jgi:superfamily II DNA or RNA helicase
MKVNSKKLNRQKEVLRKWVANQCKGTLEACTGFGKTYTAILAIQKTNEQYPDYNILVVVPTKHLKTQWSNEIKNHGLTNTEVVVINTGIKRVRECDFLILDEIHNYASSVFSKIFSLVTYKWVLGLTATLERRDNRDFLIRTKAPVVDTITLTDALKEGYVSEFVTYNVPLVLSEEQRKEYQEMSDEFNFYFSKFGHDFGAAMHCLKSQPARANVARKQGVAESQVMGWAAQFQKNLAKRKSYLYNHPIKLKAASRIVNNVDLKMITFSESIDFTKKLTDLTHPWSAAYHGNMAKYQREAVLKDFEDDKRDIRVINAAKALDEGLDVPGVEVALICSGTSGGRQNIQRTGRAIRFQEGKKAFIINLYIKNTQDEKWLRKRQEKNTNTVTLEGVDDLLYKIAGIESDRVTFDLFQ